MEPVTPSTQRPRLHPLIATAAISVIVLAAAGVTALVMNRSDATPSPYAAPVASAPAEPLPAPGAPPVAEPQAPVAKPAPRIASAAPSAPTSRPSYDNSAPITPDYRSSAPAQPAYESPPVAQAAPVCRDCGVVDSIQDIKVKGQGTGVGAVGGAVVGGLLGNMVGAGRGKTLATVAGAVGGGLGGNAIEKNVRSNVEHRMVVRLDNGTTRTFTQSAPFGYSIGERVRVVNGHVERG